MTRSYQTTLLVALSLDGYIALHDHHTTDRTSPEDKVFFRRHMDESDLVIVGNNTYKTAYENLSKRNCLVFTTQIKTVTQENNLCTYINPQHTNINTRLENQTYQKVAIIGGTQVYDYMLQHDLIDKLFITTEPVLFGSGLPLFNQALGSIEKLELISTEQLNKTGTILSHYRFSS